MADSGDATYQRRDGVVCKLVYDELAPVIPGKDTLCSVILREYHASVVPRRAYGGKETSCNCAMEVLLAWVSQRCQALLS